MAQIDFSINQTASVAAELIASAELPFGLGHRMQLDYAELNQVLLQLNERQQQLLLEFVRHWGLNLKIFLDFAATGLNLEMYFAAVEWGAHPALPVALLSTFVEQLPPPVAQTLLSDPEALREQLIQMRSSDQLHVLFQMCWQSSNSQLPDPE